MIYKQSSHLFSPKAKLRYKLKLGGAFLGMLNLNER